MSTVSITHRGSFESALGQLRRQLQELDKVNDPTELTAAVAAAASGAAPTTGIASLTSGVLGRRESTATGGVAPVYAGTVAAVGTMVESAQAHIKAARQSVEAAITDLEQLLRGIDGADSTGVRGIGAA